MALKLEGRNAPSTGNALKVSFSQMSAYYQLLNRLSVINQKNAMSKGLSNMIRLQQHLGSHVTDSAFKVVHVAGTNGKGSCVSNRNFSLNWQVQLSLKYPKRCALMDGKLEHSRPLISRVSASEFKSMVFLLSWLS